MVLIGIFAGCIERKPEIQTKKDSPVSAELTTMLREHEQMRASGKFTAELIHEADIRHRQTVYQLTAQALIVEPVDLFKAAMLLQGQDSTVCAEISMLAYYLAVESTRRGNDEARRLAAESLDKYLLNSGLPQKYGTQFGRDLFGQGRLYNYDSATTDQERAEWNVPSLDSLKSLAAKHSSEISKQR
jgi:hypothetical protein